MKVRAILCFLLISAISVLWEVEAQGQMVRDGSLGQTPGALSGPHYTIDVQNAGEQIRGNNLFHSFSDFNVNTGESAKFIGPSDIANIINRVTGQNLTNIDGSINSRAAMPNANLFLINPNGLVVGPNASFNIGGSIHLSTADYVRLGDGAQFFANLAKHSTLSSAPVTAFGFLGERTAAPLTVQAGSPIGADEGKSVSLVGGDISITGRAITAPGGQITVASLAGAGEHNIAVSPAPGGAVPGPKGASSQGTIHLAAGAMLQTSSHTGPAGSIFIRSGQFVMDQAVLEAKTSFTAAQPEPVPSTSGHIVIQAQHAALRNGSMINSSTSGDGQAGKITFEVETLRSNVGAGGVPLDNVAPVTIASNSTGLGPAGTISITGGNTRPAEEIALSNTAIVASASNATLPRDLQEIETVGEHVQGVSKIFLPPTFPPASIEITAESMILTNGTRVQTDTGGGADAGSITFNVGTLQTRGGPDGRVLISSTSDCGVKCHGGQAGDITVRGIPGDTATSTRKYVFILTPQSEPTEVFTYQFARNIDLHDTDIQSNAISKAPGGMVLIRAQDQASLTDTNISVATQDFEINASKPNGRPARNQGFSRIDIMARDLILKDSTIKADGEVSTLASCPTCQGGNSAGEIWLRVENSLNAENSSITNTGRGRAQAGITKIIKDHYFSYGAIWEPDFPDKPTGTIRLTNSEVTVESLHRGLPGHLRIRADHLILDHSILNSTVNDVSNRIDSRTGKAVDVVGAGERSLADARSVQGIILLSAKTLNVTGGGIIAPTQGNRIASRIDLQVDDMTMRPGTGPGGTSAAPRILNAADPTRVVLSSSSTGSGGAGKITITGETGAIPEGTPFPPTSSIRLTGTDVLTDTRSDALGGKIEITASGPIELHDTTISANVTDVRAQSAGLQEQGGNIQITTGSLAVEGGGISALSRGTQTGGNIMISAQGPIIVTAGGTISASNTGSGNAGGISLQASGPITIHAGRAATSSIQGQGGSILLHGADVELNSGSAITAETHGVKNAGKIELRSDNNILMADSNVSTEALKASGGDIKLTAPNTVMLKNSTLTASVRGGDETTGGKIDIDPQYVVIQNSNIFARAADGTGGRIAIQADQAVLVDPSSQIDATSSRGINGQILIQSPIQQLAGAIAPLPQAFAVAANLYGQRCAAQKGGQFSSFVQGARDGVPPQPGELLASPLLFESETAPPLMGSQMSPNLAAARLGLPEFEQVAQIFTAHSSGCRS